MSSNVFLDADGERKLADAKQQYAECQAKLEEVKPIYEAVQPAYQKYLDMKAEYDRTLEDGDRAKAALLWPGVEAQKRLYERQIANTGYSVESIVTEYEAGIRQLAAAEQQIKSLNSSLPMQRHSLTRGNGSLPRLRLRSMPVRQSLTKPGRSSKRVAQR